MIITKVIHGSWVQKFEILDDKTKLGEINSPIIWNKSNRTITIMLTESFEAGDIVEYFDENDEPIDPPEGL